MTQPTKDFGDETEVEREYSTLHTPQATAQLRGKKTPWILLLCVCCAGLYFLYKAVFSQDTYLDEMDVAPLAPQIAPHNGNDMNSTDVVTQAWTRPHKVVGQDQLLDVEAMNKNNKRIYGRAHVGYTVITEPLSTEQAQQAYRFFWQRGDIQAQIVSVIDAQRKRAVLVLGPLPTQASAQNAVADIDDLLGTKVATNVRPVIASSVRPVE